MSLGEELCGKFNTTAYPSVWISSSEKDTTVFGHIANTDGTTKTFGQVTGAIGSPSNAQTVLSTTSKANTSDPVELFMRGQSAATTTTTPLTLATGLLTAGSVKKTLVEYLYGGSLPDPVAKETSLKSTTTTTSGATLTSVREALVKQSLLLSSTELYNAPSPSGVTPRTSLIRLHASTQATPLTEEEKKNKSLLEQRNLKFFAAFLMEYCFYRTRYFYMLNTYFTAFQDTTRPDTDYALLANTLKSPDAPIANETKKNLYMRRLAYHMARCNMVMADMRKLLREIQTFYNGLFESIRNALQSDSSVSSDANVRKAVVALQTSAEELKTYTHETEFRKAAMEYNAEKNRYGTMMLAFYAVLNLSALAMIYKLR